MPKPAALFERRLDLGVGIVDLLAGKELDRVDEVAARVERRVDLEPVLDAGVVVVGAMTRRRMHRPRACLQRYVCAEHGERIAIIKRVTKYQPLHRLAVKRGEQAIEG